MDRKEYAIYLRNRYKIESWVCDWGVFDNEKKEFIGNVINSSKEANLILDWFIRYELENYNYTN